jgi:acetolactate synthase-1/3 small subunit
MSKLQTIIVSAANNPGVLARVAGLFARRGYNIRALSVSVTDDETISRMTIVTESNTHTLEQIAKQLSKLIDVIKVRIPAASEIVTRELILIKVGYDKKNRENVLKIAHNQRAKIVDVSGDVITLKLSGETEKLNRLVKLLKPMGILESSRTSISLQKETTLN